jgi:hypothetical protein
MNTKPVIILGIESSCDETAAAVLSDTNILANIIAGQEVHKNFGGVVPELASRAHQQNIIPVVDEAMKKAGVKREDISAVAFTQGPGLLGSLLVGGSFAKAFAQALNIPLIPVNHMQAHILAHFIAPPPGPLSVPESGSSSRSSSGGTGLRAGVPSGETGSETGASRADEPSPGRRGAGGEVTGVFSRGPGMTARAQRLRRDMTDAERLLWSRLREDALGVRFRRQLVIDQRFFCG